MFPACFIYRFKTSLALVIGSVVYENLQDGDEISYRGKNEIKNVAYTWTIIKLFLQERCF